MADDHEGCTDMYPPVGTDIHCTKCKKSIQYVHVHLDSDHAHSMPCGCVITMPDMQAMITQSKAWS